MFQSSKGPAKQLLTELLPRLIAKERVFRHRIGKHDGGSPFAIHCRPVDAETCAVQRAK